MRIFRNAFQAGRECPNAVVAFGVFDGVHRGHRRLIKAAVTRAKELKTSCLVALFDPEPGRGAPSRARPLMPVARRIERLQALGVDAVVLLPFEKRLACWSPESFARTVLSAQIKPLAVCVGRDFGLSEDRPGAVDMLAEQGRALGFTVRVVPTLSAGGEPVSTARVRRLLDAGELVEAEDLLGWKTR